MRLHPDRESKWPHLAFEGYDGTSDETWEYNCIAFAADIDTEWWWPDQHGLAAWPAGVKRETTPECFIEAFRTLGYDVCADRALEDGFEKIAIYIKDGKPAHAAKQLPDGRWKSKLGSWEDIEHNTLKAVEEHIYGKADIFLKRRTARVHE